MAFSTLYQWRTFTIFTKPILYCETLTLYKIFSSTQRCITFKDIHGEFISLDVPSFSGYKIFYNVLSHPLWL